MYTSARAPLAGSDRYRYQITSTRVQLYRYWYYTHNDRQPSPTISNIQKGGKFSLLKRAFTYDEAAYEGPVTLLIAVKAE